jgi:polar amino acid transport system permease protein
VNNVTTAKAANAEALEPEHVSPDAPVVPLRHPGRWISAAILALVLAMFVQFVVQNKAFQWGTVIDYLFNPLILRGLWVTIYLTVISMVVGTVLAVIIAIMRLSKNPILRAVSSVWVWFFRGSPLLVQLLFWFFIGSILPNITIGIPFGGPVFFQTPTNLVVTVMVAAILGFGLNESAYMSEIVRAGILAVPRGQWEAAHALGMPPGLVYRRIALPQALRLIIPPMSNDVITMLKQTSLAIVVGVPELLTMVQQIYTRNYQQIPLLLVATFWYLVVTTILIVIQDQLEKRLARTSHRRTTAKVAQ